MKDANTREQLESLERTAQMAAQMIGPAFDGSGCGFTLMGYTFGEGGWMTYVSNANRQDMIKAMKEMITKLENDEDIPPAFGAPEA